MRTRKVVFVISLLVMIYSTNVSADQHDYEENTFIVSPDQHEHTPRLEDFFWTGSGDGPPAPPDPILPDQPTPVIMTTTVLATVYLDSYPPQAVTDKSTGECITHCGEPVIPDSLEIPEDRRYWLLTVIQGSTPDSLQLKLARLYQKAFLRQQERHLGIIKSLDAPTPRKKHDVHSFVVNKDSNEINLLTTTTPLRYYDIQSSLIDLHSKEAKEERTITIVANTLDNIDLAYGEIKPTTLSSVESWVLVPPTLLKRKREVNEHRKETVEDTNDELIDIPLEADGNETLLFKREILKPEQQPPVQVHIQNITESEETGSVQIVYVVLVGGRAVPAAVAARDMRLVRDAEVSSELGAVVTTKAEQAYLPTITSTSIPAAYLKAAEGLEGAAEGGIHGTELWALTIGSVAALIVIIVLLMLLCVAHRKKVKSAASLRAYRNQIMRETERNQLKQVHDEKDGKLISVVSPSRTRPSSTLLPVYRADSASGSSTTSSGVSELAATLRRRQKKPHALRMPQKKRVGTTDSLLEAAGLDSSDSQGSAPNTPTSYLSMPSVSSFPRGNTVEPLSRILEPISVRHLDISPPISPKDNQQVCPKDNQQVGSRDNQQVVPRRQMSSQLVRLGSLDKDPGVIGPLVWDLHCQRIKDASPSKSLRKEGPSRMRQRFNELMDDAFTLFGSAGSSPAQDSVDKDDKKESVHVTEARNENVKLPGSPYTAVELVRGRSAGVGRGIPSASEPPRPRTSFPAGPSRERRVPPTKAWGTTPPHSLGHRPVVNPALILTDARLPPEDPALPLISAIKSEIQRIRENAQKPV